jgi:protoporphyrinogen/coproporphyrinogen III oxidase
MSDVRVIGAGLSGLATAWYLTEAGARVEVVDAAARPGGLIRTAHTANGLVESAARAFTASERVDALFKAIGVEPVGTLPASRRRFIFRGGRPRRWPLSAGETIAAAARAASAWVRRDMRPRADEEETVAVWGRRVVGPAATAWLIAPALQGIYATTPEELSAEAIFGGGRRPSGGGRLVAPRGGMGELVDRLHEALRAKGVTFAFDTRVDRIDASAPTAICTDAPAAATLLAPHAPALAAAIGRIRTVSLVAVSAFFEPHANDWRGLGVLFPRSSGVTALGVLCNTDMFPDRGALRSETWIYGGSSIDAIQDQLMRDRATLTGRTSIPLALHITPHPDALPAYDAAVVRAQAALAGLPGAMAIAGNYLGRLGVSKLIDGAAEAAARLSTPARHLSSNARGLP